MHTLRMRTTLLLWFLAVSFGLSAFSLLVIRTTIRQQILSSLASDLHHSVDTFANLQRQRRDMLIHESALLADLPSLKALMTTHDRATIADASGEFWRISGSDFFALLDPSGQTLTWSSKGPPLHPAVVEQALGRAALSPGEIRILAIDNTLYELAIQPLSFGPAADPTPLGFVAVGYAINQQVARQVSQAAAAEVVFSAHGQLLVTTLAPPVQAELHAQLLRLLQGTTQNSAVRLGSERFLADTVPLSPAGASDVQMIVLKSYDQASQFLRRVNEWIAALGFLALLLGGLLAVSISRSVTHPLETLVHGARALGQGDFHFRLNPGGAAEVRELSLAFDRMRIELRRTQTALLDSERLATIGRMASSISHDLRHYLSAAYANAEFLSLPNTPQAEREDLLEEVKSAVGGMTELIDSLLIFSRTGQALHPACLSLDALLRHEANVLRTHPDARNVTIVVIESAPLYAWVDGQKLSRALFNLLLNACQAASRGGPHPTANPTVTATVVSDDRSLCIRITDNGRGVPANVRQTLFEPFVSEGRQSGTGLGLTVAQHIAQEHGGLVTLEESAPGKTVFCLSLPHTALASAHALPPGPDQGLDPGPDEAVPAHREGAM